MSDCFPSVCHCDCHKTWGSVVPPKCYCTCRYVPQETLSLCKHGIPVKFHCAQCSIEIIEDAKQEFGIRQEKVDRLEVLELMNNKLDERLDKLEILCAAHENYLTKINKIALHDPEKTLQNMKILNEQYNNLVKRIEEIEKKEFHIKQTINPAIEFQEQINEIANIVLEHKKQIAAFIQEQKKMMRYIHKRRLF